MFVCVVFPCPLVCVVYCLVPIPCGGEVGGERGCIERGCIESGALKVVVTRNEKIMKKK
jgi:hypothetical protein